MLWWLPGSCCRSSVMLLVGLPSGCNIYFETTGDHLLEASTLIPLLLYKL